MAIKYLVILYPESDEALADLGDVYIEANSYNGDNARYLIVSENDIEAKLNQREQIHSVKRYKNITTNGAQSIAPGAKVTIQSCGVGQMTVIEMAQGIKVSVNSDGQVATWKDGDIKNVIDHPRQRDGIIETRNTNEQAEIIGAMYDLATA